MFSGKTTENLRRAISDAAIGRKVLFVNSSVDTRSDEPYSTHNPLYKEKLSTMNHITMESMTASQLEETDFSEYDSIHIDECQFFGNEAVKLITQLVDRLRKTVTVSGLIGDFKREKFGILLDLVPLADSFILLKPFCKRCSDTTRLKVEALFSHRVAQTDLSSNVDVGASDKYIPVCRKCYLELNFVRNSGETQEYVCSTCGHIYESNVDTPTCPECKC